MRIPSPAALLIAGALMSFSCGGDSNSVPTAPGGSGNGPAAATITITPDGVSPATVTVAPGSRVGFVNNSGSTRQMFSDPHPNHTECTELNQVGTLANGQSRQTGVLNTVRTCGYHDHDDPFNTRWMGTIRIQ